MARVRVQAGLIRHSAGIVVLGGAAVAVALLFGMSRVQSTPILEFVRAAHARREANILPRQLSLPLGATLEPGVSLRGFAVERSPGGEPVPRTKEPRADLTFSLDPDPVAIRLTIGARATGPAGSMSLEMNGHPVGNRTVGPDPSFLTFDIPASTLLTGTNEIGFLPSLPSVIDLVELDSMSARLELDTRSPAAPSFLRNGWTVTRRSDSHSGVRLVGGVAAIEFPLSPLDTDYTLLVAGTTAPTGGTARITASVNGVSSGGFELTDSPGAAVLSVPGTRLVVGTNRVELSLSNERGAAVEQVFLEPVVDWLRLDVGTLRTRAFLTSGFSADEQCELGTCTWSLGPRSVLNFWLRPRRGAYWVRFFGHALNPLAPLAVEVILNGERVGGVTVGDRVELHTLRVPSTSLRFGENRLELAYARTAAPTAVLSGSADVRQLAVRYVWIDVIPAAEPAP